ncbi:MAG: glycosyltransferase [Bacteroidota bacterium]
MQKISLIIPCYNESQRINLLVDALREFDAQWPAPYEVIVVNDGSKDDTSQKLRAQLPNTLRNAAPQIIDAPQNQGKGHALSLGVAAATGDFVLTLDADMATHPLELLKWLERRPDGLFSSQHLLIGSREHEESQVKALWLRRFAGGLYNGAIRLFTPISARDTQCGFKLYPAAAAKALFASLRIKGWAHDIELLYKAHLIGLKICPMPVAWQHVENEKISVFKDGMIMLFHTIYISCRIKLEWYVLRRRWTRQLQRK